MIIKLFLIVSAVGFLLWLLRGDGRGTRLAISRISGLVLAIGWIIAVCFPDLVSRVAQLAGVGRGTDLVLYVAVVAFMTSGMLQRRRLKTLEDQLVALARSQALAQGPRRRDRDALDFLGVDPR